MVKKELMILAAVDEDLPDEIYKKFLDNKKKGIKEAPVEFKMWIKSKRDFYCALLGTGRISLYLTRGELEEKGNR